ncbi:TerB family tellurite resistance protein [Aliiroseovarius sp. F20344]|uniref:tellurite resistance TerB family protein n=1 Tax=Aliiroseovarius sp. F20344 TaxID=2926414 RepID=UPI001FF25C7F|nr:TerB family tellurite resistance protein [Aliiroseovarius sp. F20344]MCK0142329.1 TerB family tellurite resistance protein [Aliiroseovarius sp. F20344]
MLRSILEKLTQPIVEPLPDGDARLAVAAILVRLARADHDYDPSEQQAIDRILAQRHGLSGDAAMALRKQAEELEAEAPDTIRFTNAVKEAVPLEDRIAILEAAWTIVLADGERASEEDALMRMIPKFLGISDMQSNLARQRAAKSA